MKPSRWLNVLRRVTTGGPYVNGGLSMLGLLPGADYETGRVDLHIGDVLVLYTDGVVEAENPEGEEYSAQRLARIVGSHLQQRPRVN
jgi:serine phosphatase RsbU (regulator of sigma subunit)